MKKNTYVVKELVSGCYKIGVTKDVKTRMTQIKTHTPNSTLYKLIDVDIEKELHYIFKDKAFNNEWFRLDENDLDIINNYTSAIEFLNIKELEITRIKDIDVFNANKLVDYINKKRKELNLIEFNLHQYIKNVKVLNFLSKFDKKHVYRNGKGANGLTLISFELLTDILFNELSKYEDVNEEWITKRLFNTVKNFKESSYSKMAGSLYETTTDKTRFTKDVNNMVLSIKKALNVNDWNNASDNEIEYRNKIYDNVASFCKIMRDRNEIVRLSIKEVLQ